ncbi:MAG TPA: diphosphomevalonate decarboxylase [Candidatus Bilamarchaeaceae archaeon]|nr:diphosphomevalonate decarboxylase [Candidatus Bilamarchaeaceae archaeon]
MKFTAVANSNIAVIKYWGKRDEKLNLPQNSSISFTMDGQLSTTTTVEFDKKLTRDELVLDDKATGEKELVRVSQFLDLIRNRAQIQSKAKVISKNSFPKGAGLASSASGFAALAAAASRAAGLQLSEKELSILARQGSGSASRSVFGGAVEWQKGNEKNGSDSFAIQLSSEKNWKHLRNIIAIVSSEEKKISSRAGMAETVKTSKLYKKRLEEVGRRIETIRNAIRNNDFESMIDAIMQDSDSMHACMADTIPPIIYMNETSHKIAKAVSELNSSEKIAAYTFDAGPNAHVYTTKPQEVKSMLKEIDGIQEIIECKIGEGIRYSEKHLF